MRPHRDSGATKQRRTTMTTKSAMWMWATCAAGAIAGCGGTQSAVGDDGNTQSVFQRTVVRLEADGTQTVSTESINAEQQRRGVAARRPAVGRRTAAPGAGP